MMITDGPGRFDRISREPLSFDGDNRTPIARLPRPARRDVYTIRIWQFFVAVISRFAAAQPGPEASRRSVWRAPPSIDPARDAGSLLIQVNEANLFVSFAESSDTLAVPGKGQQEEE